MTKIYRCDIRLNEKLFFNSREIGDTYYTEPVIGNYALTYAMEFAMAMDSNDGTVHYNEHLSPLNERGVYVTPATIKDPKFEFETFNVQTDSYWSATGRGVIVARPDDDRKVSAYTVGESWFLQEEGEKRQGTPAVNRPQVGRIRFLSMWNFGTFYIISDKPIEGEIPKRVRLGKFMSHTSIYAREIDFDIIEGNRMVRPLLNPADLSGAHNLAFFDVINIPPVPLIYNTSMSGKMYKLSDGEYLPVGMAYGVE